MIKLILSKITGLFSGIKNHVIIALIISGVAIWVLVKQLNKAKDEAAQQRNNYEVAESGLQNYKVQDSLNAVKIGALELEKRQIREMYDGKLLETLRAMDVRLRKLESISLISTETQTNVNTYFHDEIIRDTVPVQHAQYRSKWLDFDIWKGVNDSALVKSVSRDSLIQTVEWYREGFWLTRFAKPKRYEQKIMSANPNSKIKYNRFIIPDKRK